MIVLALKKSDCGANAEGGGGFQPGNTCAGESATSAIEAKIGRKLPETESLRMGDVVALRRDGKITGAEADAFFAEVAAVHREQISPKK